MPRLSYRQTVSRLSSRWNDNDQESNSKRQTSLMVLVVLKIIMNLLRSLTLLRAKFFSRQCQAARKICSLEVQAQSRLVGL